MTRRTYWGIAALIVVLIAAGGFIYYQWPQVQHLKEELAQDKKWLEEENKPVAENELPTPDPGKKWVPHDDRFHQVPIDAPDEWNDTPIVQPLQPSQPSQPYKEYTGKLTYHAELLETNPVKALRLQAEERGHPCAEWIPPFPPDDLEAQTFARNAYLSVYLDEKDPEYEKVSAAYLDKLHALDSATHVEGQRSTRNYDLKKITWVLGTIPVSHYRGNVALFPSDYFPPIRDLK